MTHVLQTRALACMRLSPLTVTYPRPKTHWKSSVEAATAKKSI